MINTVKQQENGYLMNGNTYVPNYPSNRDYREIQEWVKAGGIVEPQYSIYDYKRQKLTELLLDYNNANTQDIAYMDTTFQADKNSQNLVVAVLSAGMVPDGFYWIDKGNNKVDMTYADLQGLSVTILVRSQANFSKLQGLKSQVKAATSKEDLEEIQW